MNEDVRPNQRPDLLAIISKQAYIHSGCHGIVALVA